MDLGLICCRGEFGPCKPLEGARISGFSQMTIEKAAFFIETLTVLGAKVRWCVLSAQDQFAPANAGDSCTFFTWNGDSREEYWQCIDRALDWGTSGGPDLIIDYGYYATHLILEGVKAEEVYAETGQLPDPFPTDHAELHNVIRNGLMANPTRYHNITQRLLGVCLGPTDCVERLLQMQANGTLLFPVVNINNFVTNDKFDYLFGCRYALLDGIKRATNMTVSGKTAVVCGFDDDASKGCAIALQNAGANVVVCTADPRHELEAHLEGFSNVIETLDPVVQLADVFVTQGSNTNVFNHTREMNKNAIIFITDSILYPQFGISGMMRFNMDPLTDLWVSFDRNSRVMTLRNNGYPSLMKYWSNTALIVAILDLWSLRGTDEEYEKHVYDLAQHLEEKVSSLLLSKLI